MRRKRTPRQTPRGSMGCSLQALMMAGDRLIQFRAGKHCPVAQDSPGRIATNRLTTAARRLSRGADLGLLAGVLNGLANQHRLRLLHRLLAGPASYQQLQNVSGLQAGPLYHHIAALRMAGLVGPKARNQYELTDLGSRLTLMTCVLTSFIQARPIRGPKAIKPPRKPRRRRSN